MRKYIILLVAAIFLLGACGNDENSESKEIEEQQNEMTKNINENIDDIFAVDSMTRIWDIQKYVMKDEELDKDSLFRFADEFIMDEETFESLNEYEKGLAMKTSTIITKTIKGKYDEDEELFKEDLEEYEDVLKNGEDLFID